MNGMSRFAMLLGLPIVMSMSVLLAITPAGAASITFSFTGAVSQVSPGLFPSFNTGQTFTGSYTFNSLTPDSNPSANVGRYNGTIQGLTVNLGSFVGTLGSGTNFIEIRNQPSFDQYDVRAPLSGPAINGFTPVRFRLELIDPTATVFSNDALPTTPPSLGSFAVNRFRLVFEDQSGRARVLGSLTSLTAVPLPAAMILFGAGLIALVGLGAGSRLFRRTI